ncbi:MAG: hypothetical protein H6599_07040 [Flavobacteriales bacterium]|nr:hypothetical protein [Flavobacteriales bacterium]
MRTSLLFLFFLTCYCAVGQLPVKPGVLDGIYIQEHIPSKSHPTQRPVSIEVVGDTALDFQSKEITTDSLTLVYTHSSYGMVLKKLDTVINVNDEIVEQLIEENKFFHKYKYRYIPVLASFTDKIELFEKGILVFSITYFNFVNEAYCNGGSVLFDELVLKMFELRTVAPELKEFNTD